MLVLGRKKGEALRIGGHIEVCVVRTHGGTVSLAISAPPEMPVVRTELLDEKGADDVTDQSDSAARAPGE